MSQHGSRVDPSSLSSPLSLVLFIHMPTNCFLFTISA